jgi:integrase
MAKSKTPNERIKRAYIDFLRQATGRSEASLEAVAAALHRFESYTRFRDFHDFHIEQAKAFKCRLATESNAWTGEKLSAATSTSILGTLVLPVARRAARIQVPDRRSDAEYFNPPANQVRVATARREQRIPTVEQILHVLATMPAETDIEKRDRAVIVFTLLTGARDGATVSFKLKHIDMVAEGVDFLRHKKLWGDDDPLFPATEVGIGETGRFGRRSP